MQIHHRRSALLFFLARHRHSAAELAKVIGTSIRTVYRDIERLREDGYAVDGVPGPGGGFSLAEGCAPTPLHLGLDEVREVLFALHGASCLEYDLEERLLGALPAAHAAELRSALARTTVPTLPGSSTRLERRQTLAAYSQALARRQLFTFYDPARPWRARYRHVWPVGMVCRPQGWSLVLESTKDPKRTHWEQPLHRVARARVYNRRRASTINPANNPQRSGAPPD